MSPLTDLAAVSRFAARLLHAQPELASELAAPQAFTRSEMSDALAATNPGNAANYIKTQCFAVPAAANAAFWNANCDAEPPSVGGPIDPASLQCFNLRGNAGRNILIGPGITNLDFSVFKNNHIKRISENFNVQFRVEMFNILNHPNFAPPGPGDGNTDIFDGTGSPNGIAGALVRTTIPEREIQFAIKFVF